MSLILLKVLLMLHGAQSRQERTADCREEASLPCPGAHTAKFVMLTWYKLHENRKEGLIMKRQGREEPYVYTSNPRVGFGEKYSLTLLNATPEDSGSYECAINADIGGQNQNIRVDLVVNVCTTQASTVVTTTQPVEHHQGAAEELPLVWSLAGCGAFSLLKILVSLVTVLAIRAVHRSRRRRRGEVSDWAALKQKRTSE